MKDYYHILGIGKESTAVDIKLAYRKLAVLYHPDRNDNQFAEEKIKEINEAYHVLGDLARRKLYDQKRFREIARDKGIVRFTADALDLDFVNPFMSYQDSESTVSHKKRKENRRIIFETMRKVIPLWNKVAFVSLIVCCFLLLDYALPFHISTVKITGKQEQYSSSGFKPTLVVETDSQKSFDLYDSQGKHYAIGDEVKIVRSRLAFVNIRLDGDHFQTYFPNSVYRNYSFFPILLLLIAGFGFYFKHSIEFRFNLGLVNVFLLLSTGVLFIAQYW